ncbi:hypothetical protein CDCA_CDCA04G1442 [Cyanidium caldarium]|uniref:Sm protein B n=1 Tax=Cyanidium caldarium TaxID=2771 RepID=A0AAV9IT31_CYACA|nr:hypothetical protein CDCA_CDCA04G1442 [Cyanidium caldarium]
MDLLPLLDAQVTVTLDDARAVSGKLLAFDQHTNLVLSGCSERRADGQRRPLGLVLLRGEHVQSATRVVARGARSGGENHASAPQAAAE